jgi:hypothetical protein
MNYPISEHKFVSLAELDEKDGYIASLERAITTCAKKRVLLAEENERLQERLTAVYGANERLTKAVEQLTAENAELKAIIARMDIAAPVADESCLEPGITLSEAVRREFRDETWERRGRGRPKG